MGDLERHFQSNTDRLILKWRHYFEIYERHLAPYRGKPVRLLEFGVLHGGSLRMWRDYLGPQATIVGVDRNRDCAQLGEPGIDIVIGDQADPGLHRLLRETYCKFDIVIDDGAHRVAEQTTSFREIYPALNMGGVYLVEDLHACYLAPWGGTVHGRGTFMSFAKTMIDQLHAWYSLALQVDEITRTTYALHFYDSILVVEKRAVSPPEPVFTGAATLGSFETGPELIARIDEATGAARRR